jgi:hypothetical protein
MEFRKFFAETSRTAAELFTRHGGLRHVFHIVHDGRTRITTLAPFYDDDDDKDVITQAMRGHIHRLSADFYTSISEAWMLYLEPGEKLRKPGAAPDRIEALINEGYSRDGDWIITAWKIERDATGKPWLLAPQTWSRDSRPENATQGRRFASLFQPDESDKEPHHGDTLH